MRSVAPTDSQIFRQISCSSFDTTMLSSRLPIRRLNRYIKRRIFHTSLFHWQTPVLTAKPLLNRKPIYYIPLLSVATPAVLQQQHPNVMNISVGLKRTTDILLRTILNPSSQYPLNLRKHCLLFLIVIMSSILIPFQRRFLLRCVLAIWFYQNIL